MQDQTVTTSTALVALGGNGTGAPLPDLREVGQVVRMLISEGAAGALDEARRQAEAAALYEKRAESQASANHYSKIRLLAEAGLGVLSFDDPMVVENGNSRSTYRALAAAFERGRLLDLCEGRSGSGWEGGLTAGRMAYLVRERGFTFVPSAAFDTAGGAPASVPWSRARLMARDRGISASTLPLDDSMRAASDGCRSVGVGGCRSGVAGQRYKQPV